ncbi:hypothetical protein TeGR_g14205 [Tetraparma gracilis]|uniref:Uncharacterized protein n=1 Tax=Tetraparma gracilis TaxID=2962635 RepID=A0ABQ6MA26_9STRA|nr:hypothetical protein TeGR_g14205 [Tetraparma gracilis]
MSLVACPFCAFLNPPAARSCVVCLSSLLPPPAPGSFFAQRSPSKPSPKPSPSKPSASAPVVDLTGSDDGGAPPPKKPRSSPPPPGPPAPGPPAAHSQTLASLTFCLTGENALTSRPQLTSYSDPEPDEDKPKARSRSKEISDKPKARSRSRSKATAAPPSSASTASSKPSPTKLNFSSQSVSRTRADSYGDDCDNNDYNDDDCDSNDCDNNNCDSNDCDSNDCDGDDCATPAELIRRFSSGGYSIRNHMCCRGMNPAFDVTSPPTSQCLHLGAFTSELTSFSIEEHNINVFDATVCPFHPVLAGFIAVQDTSSWQMDCGHGRALCCARIRQIFIAGKSSISLMGAVRLANNVFLLCASCNQKKVQSFGEGEEAEVDKFLELEDREPGQPFFRIDNYTETDSATLKNTFSTTSAVRGEKGPKQKEAAARHNADSARHILSCNGSLKGKSEKDIRCMVSGGVSTMLSFYGHVGAGNSGSNWWALLIGDGPAAKKSAKRREKAKGKSEGKSKGKGKGKSKGKGKGKGNGAAEEGEEEEAEEEEEETEVVSLFKRNSDTHKKLMEASKRFMGEVWFAQLTDAHMACGCGEECLRVRSAKESQGG